MRSNWRNVFAAMVSLVLGAGMSAAPAADYPTRPVRLIVPFPPGGGVDSAARVIANPLAGRIGQPVIIYNRGGAGGTIAMDEVAKSSPDGYTLLLAHAGLTYAPGLYRKLPFDPVKDFDAVVTAVSGTYVLAVNPDTPLKSVGELVAYAKTNPGKLTYGSGGIGSSIHLAGEYFKRSAGVDILHVPYKGTGPAVTDFLGGQTQMMFGPAVVMLPLAKAGKVRALAVTSPNRSALAPELPAIAETLPGFDVVGWYGLAAPAGTPKEVIGKLNAEMDTALRSPDLVAQLHRLGYEPVGGTPDEAATRIKSDVSHWTKFIREVGIEPQ